MEVIPDNLNIPNIEFRDGGFVAIVSLPIWENFQSKQGIYSLLETNQYPSGEFTISIGGDMVQDNPVITIEHVNAYDYLTTNSEEVCKSILTKLLTEYKTLQVDYGYDEDETREVMPNILNIEEFKKIIGLSQIHILNVSKDNIAYVGYQFDCTWDEEHGLGFMTHKNRITAFGGADVSFLTWVAKNDLEDEPL